LSVIDSPLDRGDERIGLHSQRYLLTCSSGLSPYSNHGGSRE
jgi:hypothetical protein